MYNVGQTNNFSFLPQTAEPTPLVPQDAIHSLGDFINATSTQVKCPDGYFCAHTGNGINSPRLTLQWVGTGTSPFRCARCHVPMFERKMGSDHVCVLTPCTGWLSCLSDHRTGERFPGLLLLSLC
jgi:hypothetical protein